jgi:hypothetical protein
MDSCYPEYHGEPAKQRALAQLEIMGACIGKYDDATIHVEYTPPYGHEPIGDSEIPAIVDCINILGNVRNLNLGETAITDTSAPELSRLENVTYLSLNETSISDAAIPYLMSVGSLRELVLSGTTITDLSVPQLLLLPHLTFLQLYATKMSDNGLATLKDTLPGIVEC